MTEYVRAMGDERIVLEADARLANQARAVLDKITAILESANQPDVTSVDFGWTRFFLERTGTTWTVREPAFVGDASANTRRDVTLSLAVLFRQLAFTRLLGLEPEDVSFKETLIYVPKNIRDRMICAERAEKTQPGDSGWYVGPVDGDPAAGDMVSRFTSELVHVRPALLDVLLLPQGSMVTWNGDDIEAVRSVGRDTNVWTDAMRAARAAWPEVPAWSADER